MTRIATIPVQVDLDYRVLAEHICDVMAERQLFMAGKAPDTLLDANQVRALLGRAPGRPISYATLRKHVAQGHLTPQPGDDRRVLYFRRDEVERMILQAKK